jgi:hypothetical protein
MAYAALVVASAPALLTGRVRGVWVGGAWLFLGPWPVGTGFSYRLAVGVHVSGSLRTDAETAVAANGANDWPFRLCVQLRPR